MSLTDLNLNGAMKMSFASTCASTVANAAGNGIAPSSVAVDLESGSVRANIVVGVPALSNASTQLIADSIMNSIVSGSMSEDLVSKLERADGIDAIITGSLSVEYTALTVDGQALVLTTTLANGAPSGVGLLAPAPAWQELVGEAGISGVAILAALILLCAIACLVCCHLRRTPLRRGCEVQGDGLLVEDSVKDILATSRVGLHDGGSPRQPCDVGEQACARNARDVAARGVVHADRCTSANVCISPNSSRTDLNAPENEFSDVGGYQKPTDTQAIQIHPELESGLFPFERAPVPDGNLVGASAQDSQCLVRLCCHAFDDPLELAMLTDCVATDEFEDGGMDRPPMHERRNQVTCRVSSPQWSL